MSMTRRGVLAAMTAGLLMMGTAPAAAVRSPASQSAIHGTVTNAHGLPVHGAHVALENSHHHIVATATSGEHGGFHFPHVVPGHYTVRASKPHVGHGSASVIVFHGHTSGVHVVLR